MNPDLEERYIRTKRKIRKIVTYKDENCNLIKIHRNVLDFIRTNSYPSLFAKAYVPKRGIFENVKAHLYNDIFIKVDIKDFFNSINHTKLATQLFIELNKISKTPISKEKCEEIVEISSCGYPGLPLGLITSPDLANLYLKSFDSLLYGKLKKYDLVNPIFTRYADDMVVSFKYTDNYEQIAKSILKDIRGLLSEFYLKINENKTQIINLNVSNHVKITGINLIKDENNYRHISVGKKLKNKIFWKAIHYHDYPEKTSEKDIEKLKGLLSFVLSIEKEGISFSYSRGMRQLIYDRGFKNIVELISSLSAEEYINQKSINWCETPLYDILVENNWNMPRVPDPNNFTSSDILYIYKGNIRCHRYGHSIIQATAILHSRTDNEIEINVEYCKDCHKYLLEYNLFEEYRNRYGVLIGNFRMVVNGDFDVEYDLALESPLKLSGYNVGQKDRLTSAERHYILARIIHDGIMTKGDVIRYLSYFIRVNGAKSGNELAVSKWREDLAFVQSYNIAIQPRTIISDIRRY